MFTVALDVIITSELHFLYYGITPSMDILPSGTALLALLAVV